MRADFLLTCLKASDPTLAKGCSPGSAAPGSPGAKLGSLVCHAYRAQRHGVMWLAAESQLRAIPAEPKASKHAVRHLPACMQAVEGPQPGRSSNPKAWHSNMTPLRHPWLQ